MIFPVDFVVYMGNIVYICPKYSDINNYFSINRLKFFST